MIIKKNMNVNMEVTPEIVVEFFKEATYDEIMTTYNGMPREVRSEIASHFLSDLASTDMGEYRRFIGDSKPEYSESVREQETKETPEDAEEFKVGDRYKYGDYQYVTVEIVDVSDNYVKIKPYSIKNPFTEILYNKFTSTKDINKVETVRKDAFRFMLRMGIIRKVK